jgi:hypothetical protein
MTVTGDEIGNCRRLPNIDDIIDQLAPPDKSNNNNHVDIDPHRHQAKDVLRKFKRLYLDIHEVVGVGHRSDIIWRTAKKLREAGANPNEVAAVLLASRFWRNKHGDNIEALRKEVERVFK